MSRAAVVALTLALTGCAGLPTGPESAQRPISDQPSNTDARAAAKIHVELGSAYFQSGRYGVALDEARIAEAIDPGYAPVYHLLGQVYMYLDDSDNARSSFEKAVRLAPGDPEINNTYGWFLCASGEERAGIERLLSVTRNPYYQTQTRPYTNLGLCYLRLGDDGAAEGQFLRAAQADPKNVRARYHLAAIAYRRGAYEAAQAYLKEVHELADPAPDSLMLGIRIAHKSGNQGNEQAYAAQLRSRYPTSREYEQYSKGQYE